VAEVPVSDAPGAARDARRSASGDVRTLAFGLDDLPRALPLSQALRWPYRLEDWQAALSLGRGVGLEIDGDLCATGLWWPWGDAFATVGMIIVRADRHGRGLGGRIMVELLGATGERSVVLRSTREGLKLYERLGFVPFGHVHQHQAPGAIAAARVASGTVGGSAAPADTADRRLREFRPGDVAAVARVDRAASGMERARLLEVLCASGSIAVVERGGVVNGYACVRRWGRGVVIGPVVAADATDARALIARLIAPHADDFVRIDVTDASGLTPWLEELGLPCVDRVVSMARGVVPPSAPDAALFALASQSLG
jgi:GNAT superfamily N-acetyltransferase